MLAGILTMLIRQQVEIGPFYFAIITVSPVFTGASITLGMIEQRFVEWKNPPTALGIPKGRP